MSLILRFKLVFCILVIIHLTGCIQVYNSIAYAKRNDSSPVTTQPPNMLTDEDLMRELGYLLRKDYRENQLASNEDTRLIELDREAINRQLLSRESYDLISHGGVEQYMPLENAFAAMHNLKEKERMTIDDFEIVRYKGVGMPLQHGRRNTVIIACSPYNSSDYKVIAFNVYGPPSLRGYTSGRHGVKYIRTNFVPGQFKKDSVFMNYWLEKANRYPFVGSQLCCSPLATRFSVGQSISTVLKTSGFYPARQTLINDCKKAFRNE